MRRIRLALGRLQFPQFKPGSGIFGIDVHRLLVVLHGIVQLVFLCQIQAFLERFAGVLGSCQRNSADEASFDVAQAVKKDGADVGTVHRAAVGEAHQLRTVAGKVGAQIAVPVPLVGHGASAHAGCRLGLPGKTHSGIVKASAARAGVLQHSLLHAQIDGEVALVVGIAFRADIPVTDALDHRGFGRRGAVIHHDAAAEGNRDGHALRCVRGSLLRIGVDGGRGPSGNTGGASASASAGAPSHRRRCRSALSLAESRPQQENRCRKNGDRPPVGSWGHTASRCWPLLCHVTGSAGGLAAGGVVRIGTHRRQDRRRHYDAC